MPTATWPGQVFGRLFDQRRIAHRDRAEDHPGEALFQPGLDMAQRADAAAELHGEIHALEDRLHRRAIDALAGKGAVEVDDVQVVEALAFEAPGLGRRVIVEDGRLLHVAELQTHALPVLEVDGGEEDHGVQSRKLAMSFNPSAWLFSGWNWVPKILSRPTQAVSAPP